MHSLQLTFFFCTLNFFSTEPALEYTQASPTKVVKLIKADLVTTHHAETELSNIIYQSKDGGRTWQDISNSLPGNQQPEEFFAGQSGVYLRLQNEMYHSKSNLNTPVWERETVLDPRCNLIAFNRSGVVAYNFEGQFYQKAQGLCTWLPVYTSIRNRKVSTIFETSAGTVFLGCESGLYKSADRGGSWKRVFNDGWVMDFVESEGVIVGTGQHGIMRSTDNGEHWEWVINEGGVGIAVERIDGGFAAISYNTFSKSRRVRISLDDGKTWKAIDEGLQPSLSISSIKQMGNYLVCGHPDGIFRSPDMGKTWSVVHATVGKFNKFGDKKVFRIYVSGKVLYAVARDSGC